MGVYYRLVNLKTNESIEPRRIGKGGIKHFAIIHGDTAKLFTYLHVYGKDEWFIAGDDDHDVVDATEKYVSQFNRSYPDDPIGLIDEEGAKE